MTAGRNSDSDEQILFELQANIPQMRQAVALAATISAYPAAKASRHPVINFAFAHIGAAVVESQLLRYSEAVEPFLERAVSSHLGRSLFSGRSRNRAPKDPVLATLLKARHEIVAHRVKLGGYKGVLFSKLFSSSTKPFSFLESVADKIEELLRELDEADYFVGASLKSVGVRQWEEFGPSDVRAVVAAANALRPRRGRAAV